MTREEFLKIYWKQYLILERDFIHTGEYVSIDKENYDTFSHKYTQLLLAICSEMDSIAEAFCQLDDGCAPFGIINKLNELKEKYPNLNNYKVSLQEPYYYVRNIMPFVKFEDRISAEWWQAYNDVKHHRTEQNEAGRYNYTKANLKNVLYALSALYILNCMLYKTITNDTETEIPLISNLFDNKISL